MGDAQGASGETENQSGETQTAENGGVVQNQPAQSSEDSKYAAVARNIDRAYQEIPEFKNAFDRAWAEHVKKEGGSKNANPTNEEKVEVFQEVKRLSDEVKNLRNVYANDRITAGESIINRQYLEGAAMALEEAGYDPQSRVFVRLIQNVQAEAGRLAPKFGMWNSEAGKIDLRKGFNEKFLGEVVGTVLKDYKEFGFEEAYKQKQEALRRKEPKADPLADLFKIENLKGGNSQRAKILQQAFDRIQASR